MVFSNVLESLWKRPATKPQSEDFILIISPKNIIYYVRYSEGIFERFPTKFWCYAKEIMPK